MLWVRECECEGCVGGRVNVEVGFGGVKICVCVCVCVWYGRVEGGGCD